MITQSATTESKRIASIDIVKGIAIILVVYGHVMQGMAHRNLLYLPFHTFSDTLIYSFHMPAFFFASGLFARLNSKTSSSTLITKKAQQLLWPYLLWELISLATYPFVAKYTSNGEQPLAVSNVISGILLGTKSWFLWTLFVVYLIAFLTRRIERRILLVLSLVFYSAVYYYGSQLPYAVNKIFLMLPYFVFSSRWADEITGFLFSLENNVTQKIRRNTLMYVLLLTLFLLSSVTIIINYKVPAMVLIPLKLLMGLAGTFLLIFMAASVSLSRIGAVLTAVGIASLAIFLLHPYFQGLSRVIFNRIAGEPHSFAAVLFSVIIQTTASVCGAIIIYSAAMRYGGKWLFYFPQKTKSGMPVLSKAG